MTVGEKIRYYRQLSEMTQKSLSECSGVSEISIRKYEAGDRLPKKEQLQKLATALRLPLDRFIDIEIPTSNLETIGDFMTLYFSLEQSIGANLVYEVDEHENVIPESVAVKFDNRMVAHHLLHMAYQDNLAKRLTQLDIDEGHAPDSPKADATRQNNEFVLEQTKVRMMQLTARLDDTECILE